VLNTRCACGAQAICGLTSDKPAKSNTLEYSTKNGIFAFRRVLLFYFVYSFRQKGFQISVNQSAMCPPPRHLPTQPRKSPDQHLPFRKPWRHNLLRRYPVTLAGVTSTSPNAAQLNLIASILSHDLNYSLHCSMQVLHTPHRYGNGGGIQPACMFWTFLPRLGSHNIGSAGSPSSNCLPPMAAHTKKRGSVRCFRKVLGSLVD
jgi:hypothetical protein